MLPIGLLVTLWAWIGRLFLGSGGWFMLIFIFTVLPVMLAALVVAWILALTMKRRPRLLSPAETTAQLATWAGALGFGFFIVDFGDTDDSVGSVFSRLLGNGDGVQAWSMMLAVGSALLAAVAWTALIVLLVRERRSSTLAQRLTGPLTDVR